VGAQRRTDDIPARTQCTSEQIARHPGDVRHGPEIERGLFGRLHVEADVGIQHRTADAAPEEPAPEIALGEPLARNQVMYHDVWDVEPVQAGGVRAQAPFADFLPEQRTSLAADAAVETARALEGLTADGQVHAERNARAELNGLRSVIEQGDWRP